MVEGKKFPAVPASAYRRLAGRLARLFDLVDQLPAGDSALQALHGERHGADVADDLEIVPKRRFAGRLGLFRGQVFALAQVRRRLGDVGALAARG